MLGHLLLLQFLFTPVEAPELTQVKEVIAQRSRLLGHPLSEPWVTELAVSAMNERGSISLPVILAIVEVESKYDRKAKSKRRCKGYMQLSPATAKSVARKLGIRNPNLFHTKTNMTLGIRYLAMLLEENGSLGQALTIYNMGYRNFAKNKKKVSKYALLVIKRSKKIKGLLENNLTCKR